MGTWRMDLDTARWLADTVPGMKDGERIDFEECEKCGAWYRPELGHSCDNIIDLKTNDVSEDDEMSEISDKYVTKRSVEDGIKNNN